VQDDLDSQLAFGSSERAELAAEIERLETQLTAARAKTPNQGRAPFDPWLVGAILLVTFVIAVLAFRRRRMLPTMTDL
jgi:hypothetical protein